MADKPDNQKPSEFLSDLEKKLKNQKQTPGEGPKPPPRGNWITLTLLLALIAATFFALNSNGFSSRGKIVSVAYSDFLDAVKKRQVAQCEIVNMQKIGFVQDGVRKETRIPYMDEGLLPLLVNYNVTIDSRVEEENKYLLILAQTLPWILIMIFGYVMLSRQLRGRTGGAFTFGKSKARMIGENEIKVTFADVEGCEEAKEDLKEIVSFLKDPKKYTDIGAKIPKGVLLVGPPGTGKTLLAKAVAGEAKVPFFSMSGSDFVEMFVGVGASRVRDLFENGKKNAPCILFIDEIDAVGRMRGAGYGGGHDEREQTLNQLLVEMDGFDTNEAVIVMAATNRADVLDKALLRPGRFDRQVNVDVPDVKGRRGILGIHAKKIRLAPDTNLDDLARGTPGFTGADLANVINEAALLAARQNRSDVAKRDLELAKDKVMMGSERRSMIISPEEKLNTAYHEAGHALIGVLLEKSDALHKVSIIPRGRALGLTWFFPEDGKKTLSRSKVEAELRVLYGGRVAEELIFKDFTTGASNDIERATRIARAMVCEWGMSRLGPIRFGERDQPVFIGREVSRQEDVSAKTADAIDAEVKRILDAAYKDTVRLLKANLGKLKALTEELMKRETLDADEVYALLKIKKPRTAHADLSADADQAFTTRNGKKPDDGRSPGLLDPVPPPVPT